MNTLEFLATMGDFRDDHQRYIQRVALTIAHPETTIAWEDSDCAIEDDHPALREAIRRWWSNLGRVGLMVERIDDSDVRVRELAILLCAGACARLTKNPRAEKARHVRLAWVRGEVDDDERDLAILRVLREKEWRRGSESVRAADRLAVEASGRLLLKEALDRTVNAFAQDSASPSPIVREAVKGEWRDRLRNALRELFPDPCALDWKNALTRWDTAFALARGGA